MSKIANGVAYDEVPWDTPPSSDNEFEIIDINPKKKKKKVKPPKPLINIDPAILQAALAQYLATQPPPSMPREEKKETPQPEAPKEIIKKKARKVHTSL